MQVAAKALLLSIDILLWKNWLFKVHISDSQSFTVCGFLLETLNTNGLSQYHFVGVSFIEATAVRWPEMVNHH